MIGYYNRTSKDEAPL